MENMKDGRRTPGRGIQKLKTAQRRRPAGALMAPTAPTTPTSGGSGSGSRTTTVGLGLGETAARRHPLD